MNHETKLPPLLSQSEFTISDGCVMTAHGTIVRPATSTEIQLWDALSALAQQQEGEGSIAALRKALKEIEQAAYGQRDLGAYRDSPLKWIALHAGEALAASAGEVPSDEQIAEMFHAEYERLAPQFGYETRPESRKAWADVPAKNKALMIAVVHNVRAVLAQQQEGEAVAWYARGFNSEGVMLAHQIYFKRNEAESFCRALIEKGGYTSVEISPLYTNPPAQTAPQAPQAEPGLPPNWNEYLRISELPEVDECIRNLIADSTEDNAVCLVRAVLEAVPQAEPEERDYYVHKNSGGAWFVKEGDFFKQQGGLTEPWGKAWTKIRATSIEHARALAARPPQAAPVAPHLSDEEIVKVLASLGVDTYPSKYGFPVLQVQATTVPRIREIVKAYIAAAAPSAPVETREQIEDAALTKAIQIRGVDLPITSSSSPYEAINAYRDAIRSLQSKPAGGSDE